MFCTKGFDYICAGVGWLHRPACIKDRKERDGSSVPLVIRDEVLAECFELIRQRFESVRTPDRMECRFGRGEGLHSGTNFHGVMGIVVIDSNGVKGSYFLKPPFNPTEGSDSILNRFGREPQFLAKTARVTDVCLIMLTDQLMLWNRKVWFDG